MELGPLSEHHQSPSGSDPAITSPARSSDAASPDYRAWKCGRAWRPSFQYIKMVIP